MQKIRQQFKFKGRVQGVGFRYTANQIALSLGITGFIFNDWDGSVIMEAQGTKIELEQLIKQLNKNIFIEIDSIEKIDMPIDSLEKSFRIR